MHCNTCLSQVAEVDWTCQATSDDNDDGDDDDKEEETGPRRVLFMLYTDYDKHDATFKIVNYVPPYYLRKEVQLCNMPNNDSPIP